MAKLKVYKTKKQKKVITTIALIWDIVLFIVALILSLRAKSVIFTFVSLSIPVIILSLIYWEKVKQNLMDKKDMVIAGISIIALFLYDIVTNKIADHGLQYKVNIFAGETVKATLLFWVALTIMIITSIILLYRAIINHKGSYARDLVFGGLFSIIALVILFGGALVQFYFPANFMIPFFNSEVLNISLYHILGIGFYIESFFYYILTR